MATAATSAAITAMIFTTLTSPAFLQPLTSLSTSSSPSSSFVPRRSLTLTTLLAWTLITRSSQLNVAAQSPVDELTKEILASNLTSEEKFKRILVANHQRYCGTANNCLGKSLRYNSCGACLPCQCDESCRQYGDCCPDKLAENAEEVQPLKLLWSCRDNLYGGYTESQRRSRFSNSTSYLMVDSCPPASPQPLVTACADRNTYHPVSLTRTSEGQDQTQVLGVFANEQCAKCHGFAASDVTAWKVLVSCVELKNFTSTADQDVALEASRSADCFVSYIPKPGSPRPRVCHHGNDVVTSCNVTGAWRTEHYPVRWPGQEEFFQRACAVYLSPKLVDGVTYQNVFCYLCNTNEWNNRKLFGKMCPRSMSPMPFSALLDFSQAIYGREDRVTKDCPRDAVYDMSVGECRPVLCAPGRVYTDGVCWPAFSNALGLGYTLYASITLDREVDLYDENDFLHVLPSLLENEIVRKGLEDTVRPTEFELSFVVTDVDGRCLQKTSLMTLFCRVVVTSLLTGQEDIERDLLDLRNMSVSTRLLNFTTHVDESIWTQETWAVGPTLGSSATTRACSTKVSNYPTGVDKPVTFTRVHHLITRPKMQLLLSDQFSVKTDDMMLVLPWLRESLPPERYESTLDGKYYISLDEFMPKLSALSAPLNSPDEAEVNLSIFCTSLSLLCLALTFLTYVTFRQLRTSPGKNNLNLCLTLFLAQLFYLVGSGQSDLPEVCQVMGLLIHYFWLASFAAMLVCSYHMWRAFTCVVANNDDARDQWRRFLAYTVYIWGGSAAVVVVYIMTHLVVSEGKHIGYGGVQCYLSSPLGVGVAVGIPLALTVTASVVFFSLTVRTIRCSPKPTKSKEDERHVWVYFKLSSITGATWSLAFIIFFTEVAALRYVFTVVNGLQGAFIFLSFVCNQRVMKLIQHSICCARCKGLQSQLTSASGWTGSSFLRSRSARTGATDTTSDPDDRRSSGLVSNVCDVATVSDK